MRRCSGSGEKGVSGSGSVLYAHCPVCGREFSAQGRKAQARMGNPWLAIPPHNVLPALSDENPESVVGVPWNEAGYAGGKS